MSIGLVLIGALSLGVAATVASSLGTLALDFMTSAILTGTILTLADRRRLRRLLPISAPLTAVADVATIWTVAKLMVGKIFVPTVAFVAVALLALGDDLAAVLAGAMAGAAVSVVLGSRGLIVRDGNELVRQSDGHPWSWRSGGFFGTSQLRWSRTPSTPVSSG